MIEQRTLEKLLLQLRLCDLDLDGLVDLLRMSPLVVLVVLDGGGKESVDERGLAQAGLTSDLSSTSVLGRIVHRSSSSP